MLTVIVRYPFTKGMTVVDCYGHLCIIARFVGDNYLLLAVCRWENKTSVCIKRNHRTVYGNGINILLINSNGLCLTIGLTVLNTADYRLNIIKRYTVGAKICYVNIFINKHYINNIFSVGFYAERFFIYTEYKRVQFSLGEFPICYQIGYKHNSAVIYGIYSYLLCILEEYAKGKLV